MVLRESSRLRLCVPVLVDGPFGVQRCLLRNVSDRGAFIQTTDPYPIGAQIKVVFSLPGSFVEIVALGEVRHLAREESRDDTDDVLDPPEAEPVGIGVLFTNFLRNADELQALPLKLRDLAM